MSRIQTMLAMLLVAVPAVAEEDWGGMRQRASVAVRENELDEARRLYEKLCRGAPNAEDRAKGCERWREIAVQQGDRASCLAWAKVTKGAAATCPAAPEVLPAERKPKKNKTEDPAPPVAPPVEAAVCPPPQIPDSAEPASGTESNGLVYLRGGCFQMGSSSGDSNEKPVHPVVVSSFWLGKTEVTEEVYRAFVKATNRDAPGSSGLCNYGRPGRDKDPINCVTWQDAVDYCRWKYPDGGRLPTEAEWEYAARGEAGRTYPWGEVPPRGRVCWKQWDLDISAGGGTCPADSFPEGATPEGLRGMAGNVWEWVSDWYADHFASGLQRDPRGPSSGSARVLRGGGWLFVEASGMRGSLRLKYAPVDRNDLMGFRCARGGRASQPFKNKTAH